MKAVNAVAPIWLLLPLLFPLGACDTIIGTHQQHAPPKGSIFEDEYWYVSRRQDTVRLAVDSERVLFVSADTSENAYEALREQVAQQVGPVDVASRGTHASFVIVRPFPDEARIERFMAEHPEVRVKPVFETLRHETGEAVVELAGDTTQNAAHLFADKAGLRVLYKMLSGANEYVFLDLNWPNSSTVTTSRDLYRFPEVLNAVPSFRGYFRPL